MTLAAGLVSIGTVRTVRTIMGTRSRTREIECKKAIFLKSLKKGGDLLAAEVLRFFRD